MLGGNLGSFLYGEVSVMINAGFPAGWTEAGRYKQHKVAFILPKWMKKQDLSN